VIHPDVDAKKAYNPCMVRDAWNFSGTPFEGTLSPATFCCGQPQEEVLARLEWLLAERQRFALVTGDEGMGKSHLATMAVRRLGGLGAEAVLLSLRGVPAGEWLELCLQRLPLDRASRDEPVSSWQKLENRLRENRLMERPTVLVIDDLDQAPADALAGLARLVGSPEPRFSWTLVVGTAACPADLPAGLRAQAALPIPLEPWHEADVARFLAESLTRVGGDPAVFSGAAVATLARFTGGQPRLVCQVAHFALAAAAGDGLAEVDAATIERAWLVLKPAGEVSDAVNTRLDAGQPQPPAPSRPRVRAVRRLFE